MVVIKGTTWRETVLAHVKLQECGLGVHLSVNVCCYVVCSAKRLVVTVCSWESYTLLAHVLIYKEHIRIQQYLKVHSKHPCSCHLSPNHLDSHRHVVSLIPTSAHTQSTTIS